MSLRVALHHETRYCYDRRVALSPQVIRLRPASHSRTPVDEYPESGPHRPSEFSATLGLWWP